MKAIYEIQSCVVTLVGSVHRSTQSKDAPELFRVARVLSVKLPVYGKSNREEYARCSNKSVLSTCTGDGLLPQCCCITPVNYASHIDLPEMEKLRRYLIVKRQAADDIVWSKSQRISKTIASPFLPWNGQLSHPAMYKPQTFKPPPANPPEARGNYTSDKDHRSNHDHTIQICSIWQILRFPLKRWYSAYIRSSFADPIALLSLSAVKKAFIRESTRLSRQSLHLDAFLWNWSFSLATDVFRVCFSRVSFCAFIHATFCVTHLPTSKRFCESSSEKCARTLKDFGSSLVKSGRKQNSTSVRHHRCERLQGNVYPVESLLRH